MNILNPLPEKKFGFSEFSPGNSFGGNTVENRALTKIIFIRSGRITIDFTEFQATGPEIFIIRPGQFIQADQDAQGSVVSYTRHLYSSDIEDHELIFGGMLFNGTPDMPGLKPDAGTMAFIELLLTQISLEIAYPECNQEAMVRALIKQLIITCSRMWRNQYGRMSLHYNPDNDFYRFFERLVEHNFLKMHSVCAYALMLNISPKALNKRIAKYSSYAPSDIIRRRIILEAKRLLLHTPMSVKEIGYKLGYDDPSYFIRFFSKQVNMAPQNFRKRYQGALSAVA